MERLDDHIILLGDINIPSYLVVGNDRSVMIDAGTIDLAPGYVRELARALGENKGPDILVFTHSHFDHVGGAPYLKRHFPALLLGGDEYLFYVMGREGARRVIERLNRTLTNWRSVEEFIKPEDFDYGLLTGDLLLADGQTIDLGGGVTVEAIKTPGHTQDSMSYFVMPERVALTGEALGIVPGEELYVGPEFLTSFDDYIGSIKKIAALHPIKILTGHHSSAYCDQVERFIDAAIRDATALKVKIERYLAEEGMDEARVIARIKAEEYLTARQGRQPEEAYLLNLTAQVKLIKNGMG